MIRKLGLATLAIMCAFPLLATAASCPNLTRNLSFGSRGSDVVQLQQFLISQNLLAAGSDSGYFGRLTQSAVQKFQCRLMNLCSGSPSTNGHGATGPKTRASVLRACNTTILPIVQAASIISPTPTAPTVSTTTISPTVPTNSGGSISCVPFPSETRTLSCPTGQTGSITQTRASSCPGPAWGSWQTITNSCTAAYEPPVNHTTLDDFWNGVANFELIRRDFYVAQDIVVHNGAWYNFSVATNPVPQGCSGATKEVVSKSTDQGATWSPPQVIAAPTAGTPWACNATDGSAFFDADTTTWHLVFQCEKGDGVWNICHATRAGADPMGAWIIDATPTVTSKSLFQKMGMSTFEGEGTPEIVHKIADKFYMTFHGFNGRDGNRAIAWTQDFKSWFVDTTKPIFDKANCASWNVPWDSAGCIGSGWATTLLDASYYYMLIEAADKNLVCMDDQHWVFGLVRTTNLTTPSWQNLPGGPAVIFSSAQKNASGRASPCAVTYASLWRDGADIFLSVQRAMDTGDSENIGKNTGRYWYKLKRGAPVASYSFDAGTPNKHYYPSDIISRGNLEARVDNVTWLNPGLAMNGNNSVITLPTAPILQRSAPWTLEVRLTVTAEPSQPSALIAGDAGSGFLTLYKDGQLCAFAITGDGIKSACGDFTRNVQHTAMMIMRPNSVSLVIDGVTVATTPFTLPPPAINRIQAGTASPDSSNFNQSSWQGILSKLSFYDRAL